MCAGYFQPEAAQFGCLSCDSLGDFYQDSHGETSCRACAATTQRYFGLLSGANRTSCQCKAGDGFVAVAALGPISNTLSRPSMQATMIEMASRARCVTLDACVCGHRNAHPAWGPQLSSAGDDCLDLLPTDWCWLQACTPCTREPPYLRSVHPISAGPMHSCIASVESPFLQVLGASRARAGVILPIPTVHLPLACAVMSLSTALEAIAGRCDGWQTLSTLLCLCQLRSLGPKEERRSVRFLLQSML